MDSKRGKLYIFFGMAAGVGKTYAMLEAAHAELRKGVDVVVGYVERHKRADTEALIHGLPIIPLQQISYRDKTFEDMDLDAILNRKPDLVLVDELAHTNVPGNRYPKRWQEVEAILDAGIDVYTTLNVQHVESRSESVGHIVGIDVHETVPDLLLEKADQIRLVDLSSEELLRRLKEGKIYVSEKAAQAQENFFKPEILTALRELSLRFIAEKVDSQLHKMAQYQQKQGIWNTNERLMVAVSHSPYSKSLIRTTRRLAFSLDAPWIAVHVNQGAYLTPEEHEMLFNNLQMARDLGAEVVTTSDPDLIPALNRIAAEKNVTKVVLGRSAKSWWEQLNLKKSVTDQMVDEMDAIDVYILKHATGLGGRRLSFVMRYLRSPFKTYLNAFFLVVAVSIISWMLAPVIGYQSVGFLFLSAVLMVGISSTPGPILFSAALSALIWNFLFIPPIWSFAINKSEDMAICVTFALVTLIMGFAANRMKLREVLLRKNEQQSILASKLSDAIASAKNLAHCVSVIRHHLKGELPGDIWVCTKDDEGILRFEPLVSTSFPEKEKAVIEWVFSHGETAGWSTGNLSGSPYLYFPLSIAETVYGVLIFAPQSKLKLVPEEKNLLLNVVRQMAVYIQKTKLDEKTREVDQKEEAEKLYDVILNCISHELRAPITAISGYLTLLQSTATSAQADTVDDLTDSVSRLNRVITNLLDMSKLNAKNLKLNREWVDISECISHILMQNERRFSKHTMQLRVEEQIPLVSADRILLEQAFENLMINAVQYSPDGTSVTIQIQLLDPHVVVRISDQGPGIPKEYHASVFSQFFKAPIAVGGGIGLGLTIAKSIVSLHDGSIKIEESSEKGTVIAITLPVRPELF